MHPRDQTIFALSSGRPPSAIAMVRLSGPQAGTVLTALGGQDAGAADGDAGAAARREWATDRRCGGAVVSGSGERDRRGCRGISRPWRARGAGGAVRGALGISRMCAPRSPASLPGARSRMASSISPRPKALDDLIHADTDRQRRQALRQLKGMLGDRARNWRAQIIDASALIEAGIDFSDEGDVSSELVAPAVAKINVLLERDRRSACGAGPK